jgi:AbrB family looped-hinge helix DNA binding protein
MITTVTGKNQITIPSQIARAAGIRPGSKVDWKIVKQGTEIRCIVLPDPASVASRLRGAGKPFLKRGTGHPIASLLKERTDEG